MTTLNEYLHTLSTQVVKNQVVKIVEEIQRGADPFRKYNEAIGTYTEKKTYKLSVPPESEVEGTPQNTEDLDAVKALIAQGWVVKDMTLRLEKPNS